MRKIYVHYLMLALLASVSLAGCVPSKKYDSLLKDKMRLNAEQADTREMLRQEKEENEKLNKKIELMSDQISNLEEDTTVLNSKYSKLQDHYNNLLANSDKLSQEYVDQQKKIQELEKVLEDKERAVNELKQKVSNALLNFKENDLSINIKNGKVYVSLAEQLLFGSGSIQVDEKGVKALQQLAKVLRENPDINILVEGHTDDVPISRKSQYMENNWDLSVMRATSIVDILVEAGVDPGKITAAGKGEFSPLTENDSPEGRQKNRRTEIILTPELNELFQILEVN